ncbi:TPA: DUF2513 domain-containing protein [Aeromonas veronii]|uniref:DUF2513 domain-containing protein n=1 Tax=Aeromonas veronii TaxID=654 RepID=UPI0038DA47FC
MKMNWDTIRLILIELEEKESSKSSISLEDFYHLDDCEKIIDVSYNMALLVDEDLVKGRMFDRPDCIANDFVVYRLTLKGHQFLDGIRSETVWNKTKETLVTKGLNMTVDTITAIAAAIGTSMLGLSV